MRLFVAVWPTADVVEELRALPRKERPGVKWVQPENWHVTLRFLGDADPDEVGRLLDGLVFEPTRIAYGPGVDVLGEQVVIVPVRGIDAIARTVRAATADVGDEPSPRRFAGHLTLARLRRRPPRRTNVIGMPIAAEQDVEEIALVASRLRPDGPRYETVATWQVGDRRQ